MHQLIKYENIGLLNIYNVSIFLPIRFYAMFFALGYSSLIHIFIDFNKIFVCLGSVWIKYMNLPKKSLMFFSKSRKEYPEKPGRVYSNFSNTSKVTF